jgi:hypothetical protein
MVQLLNAIKTAPSFATNSVSIVGTFPGGELVLRPLNGDFAQDSYNSKFGLTDLPCNLRLRSGLSAVRCISCADTLQRKAGKK